MAEEGVPGLMHHHALRGQKLDTRWFVGKALRIDLDLAVFRIAEALSGPDENAVLHA